MLKQRLLTAFILIPLIVWCVLFLSSEMITLIAGVFVALSAWEWSRLAGWQYLWQHALYIICLGALFLLPGLRWLQWPQILILLACVWWGIAFCWVLRAQLSQSVLTPGRWLKSALGFFILMPFWAAIVMLHSHPDYGPFWLLFLLVLIWGADSGAFFVGRQWGRHKLADKVSPGKTWEGVLGGIVVGSIVAISYAIFQQMPMQIFAWFGLLCCLTIIISVLGDLMESLLKRQASLKDSGRLLPGHGGMLDRIDSLTAAAPFFVAGLLLLKL